MSAAIQNEMGRLRQEVKKWQQRGLGEADMKDAYHRELNAALERELELAVILKEMQKLAEDDVGFCEHLGRDLVELLTATDTRQCDRRDLIKQAEALDRLVNVMSQGSLITVEDTQAMAADLRQRAQALK